MRNNGKRVFIHWSSWSSCLLRSELNSIPICSSGGQRLGVEWIYLTFDNIHPERKWAHRKILKRLETWLSSWWVPLGTSWIPCKGKAEAKRIAITTPGDLFLRLVCFCLQLEWIRAFSKWFHTSASKELGCASNFCSSLEAGQHLPRSFSRSSLWISLGGQTKFGCRLLLLIYVVLVASIHPECKWAHRRIPKGLKAWLSSWWVPFGSGWAPSRSRADLHNDPRWVTFANPDAYVWSSNGPIHFPNGSIETHREDKDVHLVCAAHLVAVQHLLRNFCRLSFWISPSGRTKLG